MLTRNALGGHVAGFMAVILLASAVSARAQDWAAWDVSQANARPGCVWVQFVEGTPIVAGAAKTGLGVFDREGAKFGVYEISQVFPFLDAIAKKRVLTAEAQQLRRIYFVRFDNIHDPGTVASALSRDPRVVYVEPDYMRRPMWDLEDVPAYSASPPEVPNDPLFSDAPYMQRYQLPDAWGMVKGEEGAVVIAIADVGTDWRHPDLANNVWTNSGEIPDNGIDDDGNGFVDDVHGWNFSTNSPVAPGRPTGSSRHGTAVAGAAAAEANNGMGMAGTSWNARFMPLNVGCSRASPVCSYWAGTLYAAINGADIVTASYGGPGYSVTERQTLEAAVAEGALIVASAGNTSTDNDLFPFYPASHTFTLSAGGTRSQDDVNFYNYGRSVNVFAAGRDVVVTRPDAEYGHVFGTSFSAPLVAGIAALVKAAYPHFTPLQVREQVRLTADNIDDANDAALVGLLGRGRANAYRAVTESGFPAIRMTDVKVAGFYRERRSGDIVDLTATFTNYLADAENLSIGWFSDASFVQINSGSTQIGAMRQWESRTASLSFRLSDDAPYRRRFTVSPLAISGSYEDAPDVVRFLVNQGSVATHHTGGLAFTITTEGNFGYLDRRHSLSALGSGVQVLDAGGNRRSILFEGGLLVATGPDAVSDCLYEDRRRAENIVQDTDFVPLPGSGLRIRTPGTTTAQEGQVALTDAGASNPIGIEIVQESFMETGAAYEDVVILRYTFTNPTQRDLTDMHVGLYLHWTMNYSPESDHVRFEASRNLGIQQDRLENPRLVAGAMPLTTGLPVHYAALDLENQPFTSQSKWSWLTGGLRNPGTEAKNWAQVIGLGPFSMNPGEVTEIAFAVATGGGSADFIQNVDSAQVLWEALKKPAMAQYIQNVNGRDVDIYIDDELHFDDWAFQSASAFERLEDGEHTIDIVASESPDNAEPIATRTFGADSGTAQHVFVHGNETNLSIAVVDAVRTRELGSDRMSFYVVHGAADLGSLSIDLQHPDNNETVLLENAVYGDASTYLTVQPGTYGLEVRTSSDDRRVNLFEFDLSALARHAFVLCLSGAGVSALDGLTVLGVQSDGSTFFPTNVTTSEAVAEVPTSFALKGNYPNPFSSSTTVSFDLPFAAAVSVKVFDLMGRAVLSVPPVTMQLGANKSFSLNGTALASGTYHYRVTAANDEESVVQTGRMTILR